MTRRGEKRAEKRFCLTTRLVEGGSKIGSKRREDGREENRCNETYLQRLSKP